MKLQLILLDDLFYRGTAPTSATATVMTGLGTQISTSTFNDNIDKAEYVGYQYIDGQQHGYGKCDGTNASCTVNGNTVYNSAIKQAIDKWYAGTTLKDNDLIADQIFCNDRSASSIGANYYYGAHDRLISNTKPILTCPTASDKFTSKNSSIGNKALTYPVGLITADEVAMAGGVYGSSNSSYYLYTNQKYWLGSPNVFYDAYGQVWIQDEKGSVISQYVSDESGVRPVISLSTKAKLSGNGTYNDVYTVS